MQPRSDRPDGPVGDPIAPPRQRWRLVIARSAQAPRIGGRELVDAWETAVEESGLPLHRAAGRARGRVAFGAPLQLGIAAEHELAEIFLAERAPTWRVREALVAAVPTGWSLVDLYDVWAGGPPLAGRVIDADYRIELETAADAASIASAARALLEAADLPRTRQKGGATIPYDLRPLLVNVTLDMSAPPLTLRVRTRIHPELGTGRPEEVVAALGDRCGRALEVRSIVRERLILADDPAWAGPLTGVDGVP